MSTLQKWFPYRKATGGVELFAFPHIGAGPTLFHALRAAIAPAGVAVTGALLPGRGRRLRESPCRTMDDLVAEFAGMARRDGFSAFAGDYALAGHCSGSLVAYEIAKLLVESPCRNPRLLLLCSCLPPPLIRDTGTSRLPTGEMFARTAALGGTEDALMADRDLLEVLEPPMRADWEIFDGYVHRASEPLPVPILAVRGTRDASVPLADLRLWQVNTTEPLMTAEVEADHWVLTEPGSVALAGEIVRALSAVHSA
jgi:surfactin synthase thioesterase subunit